MGVDGSFELNSGEKRARTVTASWLLQSVQQYLFDRFPVSSGEVGLELEQSRNMFLTVGERRKRKG